METRHGLRALRLTVLAAVVASTPARAQEAPETVLVEGHVFNTLTQVPLHGAKIDVFRSDVAIPDVYPAPPREPYRTTYSDANGYYSLILPKYSHATVRYRFEYYLAATCKRGDAVGYSNSNVHPEASDEFRRDLYLDVTPRRITITCDSPFLPVLGPLAPWGDPLPPLRKR